MTRKCGQAIVLIIGMVTVALLPLFRHSLGCSWESELDSTCGACCGVEHANEYTDGDSGHTSKESPAPDHDRDHCQVCKLAAASFVPQSPALLPKAIRQLLPITPELEEVSPDRACVRLLPPSRAPPV